MSEHGEKHLYTSVRLCACVKWELMLIWEVSPLFMESQKGTFPCIFYLGS